MGVHPGNKLMGCTAALDACGRNLTCGIGYMSGVHQMEPSPSLIS